VFFYSGGNNLYYKTPYAISCAVKFYNAGVVTHDRSIGSSRSMDQMLAVTPRLFLKNFLPKVDKFSPLAKVI
jgi:hypothetical protein